jgi:hypothetical protein
MKNLVTRIAGTLALAGGFLVTQVSQAAIIELQTDFAIQPSGYELTGTDNSDAEGDLASQLGVALVELYKSDPDEPDERVHADGYDTLFYDSSTEPEYATITSTGVNNIDPTEYSALWVLAKDGRNLPAWYAWDLLDTQADIDGDGSLEQVGSNWNGTDTLQFNGIWEGIGGSISHITILGVMDGTTPPQEVPSPGPLLLLAAPLLGLALRARMTDTKTR